MLLRGNCLETLKTLPDNSIDCVVSDPPYELGFMGKSWDASGIAYSQELWGECLRVLKPGGHLLAFGGSRTYHRLASAVEDAGFEIRDQIMWLYGSGFPKSHNISKAIDKRGGSNIGWFGEWLKQEREKRGISRKELAQHFPSQQAYGGKPASGNTTGCVGNWETGVSVPTNEQFNKLCEILDLPFAKLEEAEREVIKERTMVQGGGTALQMRVGERREVEANITAPATDEAKKWEGWGTALKPSHEPIVVARKPVEGTVANNVLAYGTGGINIDATRVSGEKGDGNWRGVSDISAKDQIYAGGWDGSVQGQEPTTADGFVGRWPANTVITHAAGCIQKEGASEIIGGGAKASSGFVNGYEGDGFVGQEITNAVWECVEGCPVLNFPQTASTGNGSKTGFRKGGGDGNSVGLAGEKQAADGYADGGSAARFFTQTAYSEADYQVPSHDPVVVARKPLEGTVVDNVLKYGTGGLNIDGSRVGTETVVTTNGKGFNGSFEGGTNDNGGAEREGRWPANTMITHSLGCKQVGVAEDSVVAGERTANFGTQETIAGGNGTGNWGGRSMSVPVWECVEGCPTLGFPDSKGSVRKPTGNYILNQETGWNSNSMTDATVRGFDDSGSAARFFSQTTYDEPDFPDFFYQAKAGKKERNAGLDDFEAIQTTGGGGLTAETREDGSLETASAGGKYGSIKAKQQNFHPTVKPLALMRHLVRLVCPPNGVVLDPFLGSGTTAVAAVLEGFEWVGCELTEDYWPIIEARVAWAEKERTAQTSEATQPTLFGE